MFSSSGFRFIVHKIYKNFPIFGTPPEAAGFRTPPPNPLIFKTFVFALSKIYQCSVFRSIEGASRGTPGGGSPPFGRLPLPLQKPPRGGRPGPPRGGGVPPPCQPFGLPFDPPGHPYGVPPASPAPPPVRSGSEGGKRSAQGVSPERGWKKSKLRRRSRPQAAGSGNVGKARQSVGRGGGSRWAAPGLSTGCPCPCPRTGVAARRSRSDLHISTARGSNSAPSGGLFCPAGLTTSVQEV